MFCGIVWACACYGNVINSAINIRAVKILEEGFKGWENVSNFFTSVALKFHMFKGGVHTMVAAKLLVCKEAMVVGAWVASKCFPIGRGVSGAYNKAFVQGICCI